MHIEDRLLALEEQMPKRQSNILKHSEIEELLNIQRENLNILDKYTRDWITTHRHDIGELTKRIFSLESQNERLSKRTESTEAQIRLLFHKIDDLTKDKTIVIDSLSQVGKMIVNNTTQEYLPLEGKLVNMYIKCNRCSNHHEYPQNDKRTVSLASGNIREIVYKFTCKTCKNPIILTF
jgi:hypothetical protein